MKLNMEEVKSLKTLIQSPLSSNALKVICRDVLDTIEFQQQENEQLQKELLIKREAIAGLGRVCRQYKQKLEQLREARKEAVEILTDMVDVANVTGSAYLYRRDTERIMKVVKALGGKDVEQG